MVNGQAQGRAVRRRSRGAIRLRQYRDGLELSQSEMAQLVGIDPWYYAKIERGARKPGRIVAVRIEKASRGAVAVSWWDDYPGAGAA